jgi:hypothetical protein
MDYLYVAMRQALSFLLAFCTIPLLAQTPDFGPNVDVFSPSMAASAMQQKIDAVYAVEQHNEFGLERHAFLFMPGEYHVDVPIGFYTEVAGLGDTPDATHITGNLHVDAASRNDNATTTFWRGASNLSVTPENGPAPNLMRWAVSQAVFLRRMHIRGDIVLNQNHGWASGGWLSDSLVDGQVNSATQQQWISRNSDWNSWVGHNWNMVFVGVPHAPGGEWPSPVFTKVAKTPVIREKPYIRVGASQRWELVVPALQRDTTGISWNSKKGARVIPFSRIYIAHADRDTAATLNAQLSHGKHLLFTPGNYSLTEPLRVMRANTVLFGIGFATLKPTAGTAAINTADADGIILSGLLIDAGQQLSPVLVQIGPRDSTATHSGNPISLHDVFFRDGGAGAGSTDINLEINSRDTIVDHTWIWRADHGKGVGWEQNISNYGLVVNADDVTIYGLFVEHHQRYQVLWNGNRGRTYFYQSEIPYDPPTQAAYTSAPGTDGWASYKVADKVTQHEAWGLGIYSVFRHPDVFLTRAMEVPKTPMVRFHDMITVCLDTNGGIRNVIDDTGGSTKCGAPRVEPKVTLFPETTTP